MPDLIASRRLPSAALVGATLLLATHASGAQAAPVSAGATPAARLFGVDLGSPTSALSRAATRARVDCRASSPVSSGTSPRAAVPVVCVAPPSSPPVPVSATYWYEDGALARAFLVAALPADDLADDRARFEALRHWLNDALGAPAEPLRLPPGWSGEHPLPAALQMSLLRSGHARLSITWRSPEAIVELWLAGERGAPVLAVGMRRNAPACAPDSIAAALLDLFPPALDEVRARAASRLAACRVPRAAGALRATLAQDPSPAVQAQALRSLADLGEAPPRDELARLALAAPPPVGDAAKELLARSTPAPPAPPLVADGAPAYAESAPRAPAQLSAPRAPEPLSAPRPTGAASGPVVALSAPAVALPEPVVAPPEPAGPVSGAPLAIGASTLAGATLFRNLGLTGGLSGVTPQLLLGSAGAVIGFGTSWGLARFGVRPSLEQAAWFANTTAWGTLAGVGLWSATGSDAPQLKYGLPVLGEIAGMGVGVWSGRRWTWSGPQIVLADSLFLGAGLTSLGVGLIQDSAPKLTLADAIVAPIAMVGAAAAARYLDPTERDVGLMTTSAVAGGWTGGLLASGLSGTDLLDSHQSWGGAATGLGLGYLGGAVVGAFTETSPRALAVGGAGLLTGNALGLGLHLTVQGFSTANVPGATFTNDEVHARATSAAVGGALLAGLGVAAEPHLHLGPSATSLTLTGIVYGAGTWWLAALAGDDGQPVTAVAEARLAGGLLTGATLGGLTGLAASRWFAPDGVDQAEAALGAGLGMGAGLGIAKLATSTKGTPDALGVLLGAGGGLAAGAYAVRNLELRAPDLGGGALGLATGLLVGELVPTLRGDTWQDSRVTAGSTLLGMSLGATAGLALAHATDATGEEVGVATTAGTLGLLAGLGLGYAQPCGFESPCTSQAPRVGALVGSLSLMGAAIALEPQLHLATTLGPDAGKLAFLGGTFGFADGLLLAGVLDPSGVVSGTGARQAWGGILFGTSLEAGAGVVASKWVRLQDGDRLFLAGGKLTGALFGLGASMLARDTTGGTDTLAALAGSMGGLAAATAAQMYTPLDGTDTASAATGAVFGAFVGALVPTLDEPRWDGLDHRKTGGGLLLGLSAGAIGGAAISHATDASPRTLGLTVLGGLDGLASGLGVGLLLGDDTSSQSTRVGLVVGTSAGLALGGLVWPRMEHGPTDAETTAVATTLGAWTGAWLPALGHASFAEVSASKPWGGGLAGGGLASIAASLLAPRLALDDDLLFDAVAVDALWTAAGAGAGALVSTRDDAPVWGLLGGGTAGLVLGGALHHKIAFDETTAPFLAFAGVEGAWLGGWLPSLLDHATERQRVGALALGGFGGLGLAAVASAAIRPDTDLLADAALVDALWTGAGAGAGALLSTSDEAPVWGLLGAGVGGLVLGGALHRSIDLDAADVPFIALAGGEGAWLGGWIPALLDHPTDRQRAGALALGTFGSLGLATALSPVIKVDADVATNAVGLGLLWTGAGAGAGALVSSSDKAPVWGLLGAGSAGLVLGGTLHRSIELDAADAPLITLATVEGLWLGGWLPNALQAQSLVSDRERAGALALGGFGAAGLATAVSGAFNLSTESAGYGGLGSALGASLGGGTALLSPSLHDRAGVGLMLGGTAVGLASGLGLAPRLGAESTTRLMGGVAAGAGLGVSESLLFAWSGQASGPEQYGGAALVGGAVGASLGLAAAAAPPSERGSAPATAGFAAWGAFSGSLAGSLVGLDAHDIVFGGLIGANAGFLAGYGLTRFELVDPRDFGWLSLFGALGTVAGAGVAAPFSSGSSAPIRAGLAVGPAAGMIVGALVLPHLRRSLTPSGPASAAAPRGSDATETEPGAIADTSTSTAGPSTRAVAEGSSLGRRLAQVGSVTDWQPLVGALPASGDGAPAPVLFGLTGHWK